MSGMRRFCVVDRKFQNKRSQNSQSVDAVFPSACLIKGIRQRAMSQQSFNHRKRLVQYDLNAPDAPVLYFYHLPKTAGISMKNVLADHFWPDQIFPDFLWSDLLTRTPAQLAGFRLFQGHFYSHLYRLLPSRPIAITLLRDPVARALSHYRWMWRETDHYFYDRVHKVGSLMGFLHDPEGRALLSNFQTRLLALDMDTMKEDPSYNLSDPYVVETLLELTTPTMDDAELLARAKARLDSFVFVGLSERLQESMWLLDYMFGWWPAQTVPYVNAAPSDGVFGDISSEAIGLLRAMTSLDAELYCYAQQRFEADYAQMMSEVIERITVASHPSLSKRPIEVAFDFRLPGTGWYLPEHDAAGTLFRWLGPSPEGTVSLPLPAHVPVIISGYIPFGISYDILNSLTLTVEDRLVPLSFEAVGAFGHRFSGLIPSETAAATGLTRLIFRVSHTVIPHEVDPQSTDIRSLSLAFSWLHLTY